MTKLKITVNDFIIQPGENLHEEISKIFNYFMWRAIQ